MTSGAGTVEKSVVGKCGRKVWNKVTYFQKNASAVVKIDSATGSCLWVCDIVWVRIIQEFLPLALGDTSKACSLLICKSFTVASRFHV